MVQDPRPDQAQARSSKRPVLLAPEAHADGVHTRICSTNPAAAPPRATHWPGLAIGGQRRARVAGTRVLVRGYRYTLDAARGMRRCPAHVEFPPRLSRRLPPQPGARAAPESPDPERPWPAARRWVRAPTLALGKCGLAIREGAGVEACGCRAACEARRRGLIICGIAIRRLVFAMGLAWRLLGACS